MHLVAEGYQEVGPWIAQNRTVAATILAKEAGFDQQVWETSLGRASYVMEPVTEKTVSDLQAISDQLLEFSFTHHHVDVAASFWHDTTAP